MPDNAYHKTLRLKHFTVFEDAEFAFSPGVNALVGENGTGKTHLMKALYAVQLAHSREGASVREMLSDVFQLSEPAQLKSLRSGGRSVATIEGRYGRWTWQFPVNRDASPHQNQGQWAPMERPVFIPAIDMMGHTRGFVTTYDEYHIDFDRTHRDIVSLLVGPERRRTQRGTSSAVAELSAVLGGELELEGERFYLKLPNGKLPMTLVADGLRKVATLVRLAQAGWLEPGGTLFWDEPEVSLNPMLMDKVVAAILALARTGVQVFLATHSYTILREIEVQATKQDRFRFFALARGEQGVVVKEAAHYLDIDPNPIEVHATDLYDRGIEKRLGDWEASSERELD